MNKQFWWNCKHLETDRNLGVAFCSKNNDFCSKGKCNEITADKKRQWYREENERLKQSNNEVIELILDGVVEMHDGKRDYAETLFNKAIKLLKGDFE